MTEFSVLSAWRVKRGLVPKLDQLNRQSSLGFYHRDSIDLRYTHDKFAKNTPPFMWCPRLMLSAPQYPLFPAGCYQMVAPYRTPSVKASLYKRAIDCLLGNCSSRQSSKVTSKLRSRCPPMLPCV
ncbi:hypothetical protein TNCV_4046211 [Trichonephila clavipes]|nr:hypothetical protein TNCV_4046211 [Trichonephila clavipes]